MQGVRSVLVLVVKREAIGWGNGHDDAGRQPPGHGAKHRSASGATPQASGYSQQTKLRRTHRAEDATMRRDGREGAFVQEQRALMHFDNRRISARGQLAENE